MKTYRKLSQLLVGNSLCGKQPELIKELLYSVWLMETNFPNDDNAVVILLSDEQEWIDVYNIYPFLNKIQAEIDEITMCDNNTGFRHVVWITGQDGSGVIVLCGECHDI